MSDLNWSETDQNPKTDQLAPDSNAFRQFAFQFTQTFVGVADMCKTSKIENHLDISEI